jgi:transposase, IS5 family
VGARTFPGNPYDGDTLSEQVEQVEILTGVKPETVIVDLGYRGRDLEETEILHRGKSKRLPRRQWQWVKRRQAIEPVIGHVKEDCRMRRCWLKGVEGDAMHAVACAAGYNIRWLLRWIALLRAWWMAMLERDLTLFAPDRRLGAAAG